MPARVTIVVRRLAPYRMEPNNAATAAPIISAITSAAAIQMKKVAKKNPENPASMSRLAPQFKVAFGVGYFALPGIDQRKSTFNTPLNAGPVRST